MNNIDRCCLGVVDLENLNSLVVKMPSKAKVLGLTWLPVSSHELELYATVLSDVDDECEERIFVVYKYGYCHNIFGNYIGSYDAGQSLADKCGYHVFESRHNPEDHPLLAVGVK